ncbi:IS110 family transposase [Billgrantia lactosivorans]|uniref:IS110 family transposase n=1 Tax=Billgrantia lactosivorans TaxID=2185141 RepID=UPI000DAE6F54
MRCRRVAIKLDAAQFVKQYVKSNKNYRVDAETICGVMRRPNMSFVAVKTVYQQDVPAAHRFREELVRQRTAKANQIRGLIGEYYGKRSTNPICAGLAQAGRLPFHRHGSKVLRLSTSPRVGSVSNTNCRYL